MLDKKSIRRQVHNAVSQLTARAIETQSSNSLRLILGHPAVAQSARIGVFMNMEHEVRTLPLIEALISLGKTVYLPHCTPVPESHRRWPKQQSMLQFFHMQSFEDVLALKPQGKYNLREPTYGTDILEEASGFDLLIVPAMGFSPDCYRIGYGAGFYDDYIKRHVEKFQTRPFLLGWGLSEQLVSELPLEPHDEQLDECILDSTVYKKS